MISKSWYERILEYELLQKIKRDIIWIKHLLTKDKWWLKDWMKYMYGIHRIKMQWQQKLQWPTTTIFEQDDEHQEWSFVNRQLRDKEYNSLKMLIQTSLLS